MSGKPRSIFYILKKLTLNFFIKLGSGPKGLKGSRWMHWCLACIKKFISVAFWNTDIHLISAQFTCTHRGHIVAHCWRIRNKSTCMYGSEASPRQGRGGLEHPILISFSLGWITTFDTINVRPRDLYYLISYEGYVIEMVEMADSWCIGKHLHWHRTPGYLLGAAFPRVWWPGSTEINQIA